MDKEIAKKIKESFETSLKFSTILMTAVLLNPNGSKNLGVTVDDILYLNKNYYDIKEYIDKVLKEDL